MENSTINIEKIMQEIREKAKNIPHDNIIDFDQVPGLTMTEQIKQEAKFLKRSSYIPYYRDMGGGIKGVVKRLVRKIIKSVIFPMSENQNEYNIHVANGVETIGLLIERQQEQIKHLQSTISTIQNQLEKNNNDVSITENNGE